MAYEYSEDNDGVLNQDFQDLMMMLISDDKNRSKHETYTQAVEHAEEMSVHLYGKKPLKLLEMVRPREEAETKKYRLEAYQPTTESTAEKALGIVSKIFNPTLYTIQWPENNISSEELKKYSMEDYPGYNSVTMFLQQVVIKKMLADPNAILAVTLVDFDITDAERAKPYAVVYGSQNIWYQDQYLYIIFKKKEAVASTYARGGRGDLFYFCLYDKNSIVEFTAQKLNQKKIEIKELYRYNHNFGEIPAWCLRGTPESLDNGNIYYKSFFKAAIPFWNLAINHESDLFGAYINHLHPIRAELAEECDYIYEQQRCAQGKITLPKDGKVIDCPSCLGTGYRSVKSPFGVYRYNKDKLTGEGNSGLTPVQYITVPTEPTSMLENRVDKLLEKGLNALNMDILNKIGENQSGVAKVIDRGELYDFLYRISTVMFDIHLADILYYFNKFMFAVSDKKSDKNLPQINKPVQFDISSAVQLVEEMKAAKDAGLNPQYLREMQKQVNGKQWASSPDIKAKLDLMLDLDPAPEYSLEDITIAVDAGLLSKEFGIIHTNIEFLVGKALTEHKDKFLGKTKEEKMAILIEYAKKLKEEMEPKLDTSAIDTGNTSGAPGQEDKSSPQ